VQKQQTISHPTINKLMMIVGAVFVRSRRRGLVSDNPARRIERLKEPAYDDLGFYDPDEGWRVVNAAASEQDVVCCWPSPGCAEAKRCSHGETSTCPRGHSCVRELVIMSTTEATPRCFAAQPLVPVRAETWPCEPREPVCGIA
jgi:hypothetical protein